MSLFSFDTKRKIPRIPWLGLNVHRDREIDQSDSEQSANTLSQSQIEWPIKVKKKIPRKWSLKLIQRRHQSKVCSDALLSSRASVLFRFSFKKRGDEWIPSSCLFWASVGVQCCFRSEQFSSSCVWATRRCSRVWISRTIESSRDHRWWNKFKGTGRSDDRSRINPSPSSCSLPGSTNTSISDTDGRGRTFVFVERSCLR